jgi:hypothetical protein
VVVLLQAGAANIHEPNNNGITPLDFARMLGEKGKEVQGLFQNLEKQIELKKRAGGGAAEVPSGSRAWCLGLLFFFIFFFFFFFFFFFSLSLKKSYQSKSYSQINRPLTSPAK